jgi:competence protein ComEA
LIAFFVLAAAVLVGAVLLIISRPAPVTITINPPPATLAPAPTGTAAPITVYVTGAVNQPETLVTLLPGSRTADAVSAAGGAAENADLSRVDMASLLQDGDHIHVYAVGEAQIVEDTVGGSGETVVVHINRATLEELDTLPGIGPALAQRIIDYRTANGNFTSLESLTAVSGIGEGTVAGWEGLVAFD